MSEYHKIQTVFLRDPATGHKTLLDGEWTLPEFAYLADNEWVWTEKVDGTNIRVIWDGATVRFGGKTDNAQIPTPLLDHLMRTFMPNTLAATLHGPLVLYGEGFGAKIQKAGERYRATPSFILFDAAARTTWLERETVTDIASALNIPVVPVVGRGTLREAVEHVRTGFPSMVASDPTLTAEGLVMRPAVELMTRRGNRIITKIKHVDFREATP